MSSLKNIFLLALLLCFVSIANSYAKTCFVGGCTDDAFVDGAPSGGVPDDGAYHCPDHYVVCKAPTVGMGAACGNPPKYARCACPSEYKYTTQITTSKYFCDATDGYGLNDTCDATGATLGKSCSCKVTNQKCGADYECVDWKCKNSACSECRCKYSGTRCSSGQTCSTSTVCDGICPGTCKDPTPPTNNGGDDGGSPSGNDDGNSSGKTGQQFHQCACEGAGYERKGDKFIVYIRHHQGYSNELTNGEIICFKWHKVSQTNGCIDPGKETCGYNVTNIQNSMCRLYSVYPGSLGN